MHCSRLVSALMLASLALAGCGESHETDGGGSRFGDPCSSTAPCPDGLSCVTDARFPGGYCTQACADGACPDDAICDGTTSPALCLARCAASSDCRDGYQCWRSSCRPACVADADCGIAGATCGSDGECIGPECTSDSECPASEQCVRGTCVIAGPDAGSPRALGAACARDAECESGVCAPAALGGVCTRECTQASDCFDVGEAGCSAVPIDTNADGSPDSIRTECALLPAEPQPMGHACTSDRECEASVCQDAQCTEVCDDDTDCVRGEICTTLTRAGVPGATYSGCGYATRAGSVVVEEIDLGELDIRAGAIRALDLATPPDVVSLTLQAQRTSGDPLDLSFGTVIDPTDATLFDLTQILMLTDQPDRWLPIDTGEVIAMLVPNSTADRIAFRGGVHQWSVGTFARTTDDTGSARVHVSALIKRAAGGRVDAGTLDLNVFLVGVGVTAATAASDTRLSGALARLDGILGEAGIRVGDVAYFDVTGADATTYQVVDSSDGSSSELAGLFRLSAPRSGRRLNIFLVRSISGSDGGFHAIGIAGGIPGPVGIHGTQHSGVVVAFDPSVVGTGTTGANVVGHVLAHEISHYLGLFHSTEQARACGPGETPADGCAPFGAGDVLADTTRGDTTNLMYWSIVGSGTNDRLSAGQGFVLRASALVGP